MTEHDVALASYLDEAIQHLTTRPSMFGGQEATLMQLFCLLDVESVAKTGKPIGQRQLIRAWRHASHTSGPALNLDENLSEERWSGLLKALSAAVR